MDITGDMIAQLGTTGLLAIAVIYLWKRVEKVTDAYLDSMKDASKIVSDNSIATNNYSRSLDALTTTINGLGKEK